MNIKIIEALRLKNDISTQVRALEYTAKTRIVMGNTFEDGIQATEGEGFTLAQVVGKLETALQYSEEINGKIAEFNRSHNIDNLVRKMHNHKLMKEIYENLLPRTKPTLTNTWTAVGDTRKQVVREYRPLHTSKDIKTKINDYKQQIRETQSQIETLNQETITLSFSPQDVDNLALD